MITGHGNDRYLFGQTIRGDFSSNVAYNNYSDRIVRYLRETLDRACNYPDPKSERLTHLIAEHHGITSEQVLVTAGSAEAFYLTAHCFRGAKTAIAIPSFAEYEDSCALFGHKLTYVPLVELNNHFPIGDMDTVWWGSPNNPEGRLSTLDKTTALLLSAPGTHFVVDCAYTHLSQQSQDLTPLHAKFPNLITIHSLTKAFGIPGLRLGYIITTPALVEEIRNHQIPWSVNAVAQEAGRYIMEHYDALLPDVAQLTHESRMLQRSISQIEGLEVIASETNYFLIRMQRGTAAKLKQHLIEEHGLLIRDASNFRGLTPQHFRIAVQAPETNKLLIDALTEYLNTYAE